MNKLALLLAFALIASVYTYGSGGSCYMDNNLRLIVGVIC
jgi:hypothetical protein